MCGRHTRLKGLEFWTSLQSQAHAPTVTEPRQAVYPLRSCVTPSHEEGVNTVQLFRGRKG